MQLFSLKRSDDVLPISNLIISYYILLYPIWYFKRQIYIMTIWNTRQGHNDRVRVGQSKTNLRRKRIWGESENESEAKTNLRRKRKRIWGENESEAKTNLRRKRISSSLTSQFPKHLDFKMYATYSDSFKNSKPAQIRSAACDQLQSAISSSREQQHRSATGPSHMLDRKHGTVFHPLIRAAKMTKAVARNEIKRRQKYIRHR